MPADAPAAPAAEPKPAAAAPAPAAGAPAAAAPAAAPAAKPDAPAPAAAPKPGDPPAAAAAPKSLLDEAADDGAPAKPGDPPAAKPGDKPQGAPESYTDFKLPEGFSADAKLIDSFKAAAKDMNLSQENAQKLVTLQAEYAKTTAETLVSQAEQQRTTQIEAWKTETKTALGAEWKKELGFASKALDAFWPPEARALLAKSGFGDHPQFVPGLVKLGKALSETNPGVGNRSGITDPKEATNRSMFPKMYDANGNYIGGAR